MINKKWTSSKIEGLKYVFFLLENKFYRVDTDKNQTSNLLFEVCTMNFILVKISKLKNTTWFIYSISIFKLKTHFFKFATMTILMLKTLNWLRVQFENQDMWTCVIFIKLDILNQYNIIYWRLSYKNIILQILDSQISNIGCKLIKF